MIRETNWIHYWATTAEDHPHHPDLAAVRYNPHWVYLYTLYQGDVYIAGFKDDRVDHSYHSTLSGGLHRDIPQELFDQLFGAYVELVEGRRMEELL